ncbi:MAG: arylsulfatase [Rikenellaceae bacterium]
MKREFLPLLLPGLAIAASTSCQSVPDTKGMNVVFILTDDQGYGDLGFTGNPDIKTPNIDKLAGESFRCTNYHTGSNSAPTRASLMTGMYNNRVGVWHTVQGRELLSLDETTMAEVFKANDYRTGMFGKWHLGDHYPYRPSDRGFEETLCHKGGGIGQTPDYWGNDYFDDKYYHNDEIVQAKGYCTDVFFDAAKEFITKNKDEQFFCYISTNAPHAPRHIEERYAAPYRGNKDIVSPQFYGMIANIDENVGQVDQLLSDLGIADNTIVIFSTDNGSAGGVNVDKKSGKVLKGYNAGMRGRKGFVYEGGHRVPFTIRIPGRQPMACEVDQLIANIDLAPTFYSMLGLKYDRSTDFDGIDLSSIFENPEQHIDRYLVVDTQRGEFLEKYKSFCVIKDQWRLVDKELYDIKADPSQESDISAQHPDLVEELSAVYESWWDRISTSAERMQPVYIASKYDDTVYLNAHDRHDPNNSGCLANQTNIRSEMTPPTSTFWAVNVPEDGIYDFALLRWPVEAAAGVRGSVPAGGKIPNGKSYQKGVAFTDILGGEIIIGDEHKRVMVDEIKDHTSIEIKGITLKRGEYKLFANFITSGEPFGAQYVGVTKR